MINRSFYLIHEQVERKKNKRKHDKIIHTHTRAHRLRKKEIGNHVSLSLSTLIVNFAFIINQYGRIETDLIEIYILQVLPFDLYNQNKRKKQ